MERRRRTSLTSALVLVAILSQARQLSGENLNFQAQDIRDATWSGRARAVRHGHVESELPESVTVAREQEARWIHPQRRRFTQETLGKTTIGTTPNPPRPPETSVGKTSLHQAGPQESRLLYEQGPPKAEKANRRGFVWVKTEKDIHGKKRYYRGFDGKGRPASSTRSTALDDVSGTVAAVHTSTGPSLTRPGPLSPATGRPLVKDLGWKTKEHERTQAATGSAAGKEGSTNSGHELDSIDFVSKTLNKLPAGLGSLSATSEFEGSMPPASEFQGLMPPASSKRQKRGFAWLSADQKTQSGTLGAKQKLAVSVAGKDLSGTASAFISGSTGQGFLTAGQDSNTKATRKPKPTSYLNTQLDLLKKLQRGEIVDIEEDGVTPVYPSASAKTKLSSRIDGPSLKAGAAPVALPWCSRGRAWNTSTPFARFDMYGCLKISGIHTAQTHLKTVIVIDRTDANNTYFKLPNSNQNAYGEELTLTGADPLYPAEERALNVKSNVFCSAGQILADGSLLSVGGSSDATNADPLLNGSFALRRFKPCLDKTCDFELIGDMTSKRWYPTAQVLPDGRVFIVGGANVYGNIAINTYQKNNPTVEYYPRKKGEGNYFLQFLVDTLPFNLYAFVHVLPSGRIFIFAADRYILFDTRTNQQIPGNYPPLNVTTEDNMQIPIFRSYPVSGSSAMFPLSSANNYTAEIMICGGNNAMAVLVPGNSGMTARNGKIPGDYLCWRITPEAKKPFWAKEKMCGDYPTCATPYRRVMPDMVLLVDGSLLILNGAQQGFMGLKQSYSNLPILTPMIYFTNNHTWSTTSLPNSMVARVYHSAALLLHDATVLVSGSNPNPTLNLAGGFPTEFRMEKFVPPYLMTGRARPTVMKCPYAITIGSMFAVYFNAPQKSSMPLKKRFTYSLVYPGFATHNQRHGMRHLFLDSLAATLIKDVTYVAVLKAPPNANLAPPTMYWLHILDSGVPNDEGFPVNVTISHRAAKRT